MLPNRKITQQDIMSIVAVSLVFDLVQGALDFVPILGWALNWVVDLVAWVTFYVWFKRLGVDFTNFKRFLYFNSGLILDFIPFINMFAWTIDVAMVLYSVKKDEISQTTTHA